MIEGGKTPCLTPEELAQIGFKIVVYPLYWIIRRHQSNLRIFKPPKKTGTTQNFTDLVNFSEFAELIEIPKYKDLEKRFSSEE